MAHQHTAQRAAPPLGESSPSRPPTRVQQSRQKGWRLPPRCVVVSQPSRWSNPYIIGTSRAPTRAAATQLFRDDLLAGALPFSISDVRRVLAGRDLACWCPPGEPCHGDVLLEFANARC